MNIWEVIDLRAMRDHRGEQRWYATCWHTTCSGSDITRNPLDGRAGLYSRKEAVDVARGHFAAHGAAA